MNANEFDRVAFIYDTLARLFFGRSIRSSQAFFLDRIASGSSILVVGSGTGWIAEEILCYHPKARITLVDTSGKMTSRAKRRLQGKPVTILCTDEHQKFSEPFDAIILPFFLDMFPNEKLKTVLGRIRLNANLKTLWLVTDFVSQQWWHRAYLKVMYVFFQFTSSLETRTLPDWEKELHDSRLISLEEKYFYFGFIKSGIYSALSP